MEFLASLHPLAWVAFLAIGAALVAPTRAFREFKRRPWKDGRGRDGPDREAGGPPQGSCGAPHMAWPEAGAAADPRRDR
ncbi:hypothetical protein JQC91_01780 [Jannaschia sp. Os4]|uniref:hypothetical protein n=1 Tax=Jannaschia sp. Os4 TaxID=2807617 RepID=UPI0019395FA0|nr:hypothetical protein [Jannaschia sp. Os4]MBM2575022.1 hypothetical protein [Jannaschia sp. Os4]